MAAVDVRFKIGGIWLCGGLVLLQVSMLGGQVNPGHFMANGFDLRDSLIDPREILSGGVWRDGIPALTDPKLLTGEEAWYLKEMDFLIGVRIAGEARAYPLRILNYHEIVNDELGGEAIVVILLPIEFSRFYTAGM